MEGSSGPLDRYRQLAAFDRDDMKRFIYSQEYIDFERELVDELQRYPELCEYEFETPRLDEMRRTSIRKLFMVKGLTAFKHVNNDTTKLFVFNRVLYILNGSVSVMNRLAFSIFVRAIEYMGTERHYAIAEKAQKGEILGSFALTEIGHGSNTRGIKTTAKHDVKNKQFILNSPSFEAAKCWSGLIAYSTHTIVFAQLYTSDGVHRGLHAFIVPLRDPHTLLPYPGIKFIDMGEKIGLNGMSNGIVMFDNYCIPHGSLLNRLADVASDGTFRTNYNDVNQLHGANLKTLSSNRILVSLASVSYLTKAISIAVRYSAVRKQFGIGNGNEEVPILEYQTHQFRLFPYIAVVYCFDVLMGFLLKHTTPTASTVGNIGNEAAELHALSSSCKAITSWFARDGIQESREACGGHGYLKAAGLGVVRSNQDVCCTYEGDNHLLLQQTSKWLLKFYPLIQRKERIHTPFKSLDFLNERDAISASKLGPTNIEELIQPQAVIKIYQWLVYYLLKRCYEKYQAVLGKSSNQIVANNESQVYCAIDLAKAYIMHFCLFNMYEKIKQSGDSSITHTLSRLLALQGLWNLEKHLAHLYIGGYASGPTTGYLIQEAVLRLCKDLKNDSVALVDVIAPPDLILHSVLGHSDGQVYKRLEAVMLQTPGALSRPDWWKEIVHWKEYITSKL